MKRLTETTLRGELGLKLRLELWLILGLGYKLSRVKFIIVTGRIRASVASAVWSTPTVRVTT